jgi:GH15 family glucan-1,4-alpha-glucosidase
VRRPATSDSAPPGLPAREDGYAPIRDYAALGDGRTVALVARDGSIDWLCLPNLDSPSVFGALVDARRGGRFALEPELPYGVERRYLPGTNVLETTFETAGGAVRITDCLTFTGRHPAPERELVRRVEGLAGRVPLRWVVEPRFDYARATGTIDGRAGYPGSSWDAQAIAVLPFEAGEARCTEDAIEGRIDCRGGERACLVLAAGRAGSPVAVTRAEAEDRLDHAIRTWERWSSQCRYEGPWRDAVLRSGLALKLLVCAPSGAIAAAPTTSLPEAIGHGRNWDYRYAWVRDAAFTLNALLGLGFGEEARGSLSWLLSAWERTYPDLKVLYRLDGSTCPEETELLLDGYRSSRPVRIGNRAASQLQLSIYGDLLDTVWLYAGHGFEIYPQTGVRLAAIADRVCEVWPLADDGIWEVRGGTRQFAHSKLMCWVALDRALQMSPAIVPDTHAARWRRAARDIRAFLDERCFSEELSSYVRTADGEPELDASLLLAATTGFCEGDDPRLAGTVEAVRTRLADGPLVYRYRADDGLEGREGAFLACSFWLVQALTRVGRLDEAVSLMDELVGLANDVGLYSEEIDPATGAFLGNMPQGLTHLALVNAALALGEA